MTVIYEDPDGVKLWHDGPVGQLGLRICGTGTGSSRLDVPAVDLPGLCRGLYVRMGLPVPDLPPVVDPAEVAELAKTIRYARDGVIGGEASPGDHQIARVVLGHGWRKRGER